MARTSRNRPSKKKKKVKTPVKTKEITPLSQAMTEKLTPLVNINDVSEHGFSKDTWVSLSLEEKLSVPAFISSHFRCSDGTKADKAKNLERKRDVYKQIMKYQKFAQKAFYSTKTKKIKSIKANDSKLSNSKAAEILWNELNDDEKNVWYNEHTGNAPAVASNE